MNEYSLEFSEKLTDAAQFVVDDGLDSLDAKRTVLYLSQLSCEIALKALLERAGVPVAKIKPRWHNLSELLQDLCACKVEEQIGSELRWILATSIRAQTVDQRFMNTVGSILEAEAQGASKYPNEVRYGYSLNQYPPELWLKTTKTIIVWARKRWDSIRA